ncbi:MAG TPA: protein-disulfide reductase DsbD domain-containing protein, partial [Thermoanaerobaculia bacterium]|nr:protein-disulfide reductase DsbD domain-containing protein [Thermoanaerobaculia bacterium]
VEMGKAKLLAARANRDRPLTDDKVLADWNGMLITGLAVAGKLLGERSYIDRAARAADFLLTVMRPAGGPLLHAWRQGQGKIAAYLGDYVFVVRGLLALHEATGDNRWLSAAVELTEEQSRRLRDPQGGYFVAGESPDVLFRSKDVFDGATPSGNAVAVLNLLELAARTGDAGWRVQARHALQAFAHVLESHPDAVRMMTIAALRYHRTETGGLHEEREAAHERDASAAGVRKLEQEAGHVVGAHLSLGEESGGFRPFRLALEIAPGWHLQANPASEDFLVPTEVRADGGEVRNVRYPEGETVRPSFLEEPLSVYSGRVVIEGEVSGGGVVVVYQACDEARCLPPVERRLGAPRGAQ